MNPNYAHHPGIFQWEISVQLAGTGWYGAGQYAELSTELIVFRLTRVVILLRPDTENLRRILGIHQEMPITAVHCSRDDRGVIGAVMIIRTIAPIYASPGATS